ncbi:phage/plasmid primase, P4 family [Hyphomicrobium sp. CS1BSMeth3]|uniref:DNA primase family protein n=1 Tax=Hyphomicrobium sp. CS1BSMeth3 TaxID=1892844 RepID=UPI0015764F44|nr:phage/plasmid primase, P4 family [Hyphomicrobium sp. CS1BSMeth3]
MPPADEFLAVRNGLLHIPSETLHPATAGYFGLNVAGTAYDPEALEPQEWLRFLGQLWGSDPQSIETLQEIFGYLISADTSQQKIPLIVGPKRSGKGTIARVLTALLGKDSVASPTLNSLDGDFGLASLIGKPVAIIGDARLSARANQAVIAERLLGISGEDTVQINRKYLPEWIGRLPTRFVLMTNELPRLADASGALASRFIVLTMAQSFYGKEDRGLYGRLSAELPGILNWAIEGFLRLRQRGYFQQPESARDAIDELEALGSPVAAFIKEKCTVGSGQTCQPERVFEAWKNWCANNGRREPGTVQSFGRDLRAAVPGLSVRRPRAGGSQQRMYEGISIGAALSDW